MIDEWWLNDMAGNINSGAILNRNLSPKGLADNEINKNYCACYQSDRLFPIAA